MKNLMLLIFFNAIGYYAVAQVSGYAGKRNMVKYSLEMSLLEKGFGVEWERVLTRNLSTTFSYENGGRSYLTILDQMDLLNGSEIKTELAEPLKSSISFSRIKLGFKKYWDPAFPAPIGWYTMLEVSLATNTINTQSFDAVPKSINISMPYLSTYYYVTRPVEIRNLNSMSFGLHFGKQGVLGKRWVLDFRYGFMMNKFDYVEKLEYILYPGSSYSSNIANLGVSGSSSSSDDGKYLADSWSLGFSAFLKIGVILF